MTEVILSIERNPETRLSVLITVLLTLTTPVLSRRGTVEDLSYRWVYNQYGRQGKDDTDFSGHPSDVPRTLDTPFIFTRGEGK